LMERSNFSIAVLLTITLGTAALAEPISVKHIQHPMHRFMAARSEAGKIIASGEFSQVVQGDEVMMRLTYRFVDGSIDDETTTYRQQGTFRLVRNHHIQKGPFFVKPVDFAVEAATGVATSRTADKNGNIRVESEHLDLPDDLANGFVGTLLLNVPHNTTPFRVGILAPVGGGRLIHILIAPLIGLQPKDVMVWILEGEEPAVVRIVGQLGGHGPVVSSELEGTSFGK
jgi:hypothetical protein